MNKVEEEDNIIDVIFKCIFLGCLSVFLIVLSYHIAILILKNLVSLIFSA